ncbi:MAG: DUF971 domain-containing protein [Hahellaceae bacterium]|nr:DUF971 domain-containing protein [Hahellaceae bacterium]MCP5168670.1 DUF971 domain-containing protein [Hahellaceae bacterium]
MANHRIPSKVEYKQAEKQLVLHYGSEMYSLSCEYLRVHSPSAEVKGHGPGQEILQTGKRNIAITKIEPVGNYALKLTFDDGHDSGLYDWAYLEKLAVDKEALWQVYLDKLTEAGASREPAFFKSQG